MTMDDTRVIHLKLSNGATSDLVALALFSMAYSCKNPSGILPSLFFQKHKCTVSVRDGQPPRHTPLTSVPVLYNSTSVSVPGYPARVGL